MDFLDEAVITVVSGDGGKGCVSFRRERFIPKGGPDGGNGGDGGNVIIKTSRKLHNLSAFSSRKYFKSQNGGPGRGKNQTGKDGEDTIIRVPLGTTVYDNETDEIISDLISANQEILILPGGKGGKGNAHFKSSTNRTPRFAQPGLSGQKKSIRLSLKYIADIGLVGLPNSGKSTLLARLTTAHPKIENYPFTTIVPNLGVLEFEDSNFLTLADIPGLIEGASKGRGLGYRFLKHIERTRFLLHLIDITITPSHDIIWDFKLVQHEMEKYNASLPKKDQIVLINKIDIRSPGKRDIETISKALDKIGIQSLAISALTGEGIDPLKLFLKGKFFPKSD